MPSNRTFTSLSSGSAVASATAASSTASLPMTGVSSPVFRPRSSSRSTHRTSSITEWFTAVAYLLLGRWRQSRVPDDVTAALAAAATSVMFLVVFLAGFDGDREPVLGRWERALVLVCVRARWIVRLIE